MTLTHLLILLIAVAFCTGQQTFSADFIMRDPSGNTLKNFGAMQGRINYDYSTREYRLSFSKIAYDELWEFNTNAGATDASNQYIHKISQLCSSKCETTTNQFEMPRLWQDTNYYSNTQQTTTIGGRQCTQWNRSPAKTRMPVTSIWFDGTGSVCKFVMGTRDFELSGNSAAVDKSLFATPTGCKCGKMMDVALVLDSSGSISAAEWSQITGFVKNFVSEFKAGPLATGFATIQFCKTTQVDLPLTTDQNSINTKLVTNALKKYTPQSGTCLTCGLVDAIDQFKKYKRAQSVPVVLVATDGYHNVILRPECTGSATVRAVCDIKYYVNRLVTEVPGALVFAVGVKEAGPDQLLATAQGDPSRVFQYDTYATFSQQFQKIAVRTCEAGAGDAGCGACCGFCACGTCLAPDTCNDGNSCTKESLNGQCCGNPAPFCFPPNKCKTSTCNAANGQCVEADVVCPAINCKQATCDPALGCVYTDLCPPLDACTPRTCNNNVCTNNPVQCAAGDQCTSYSCNKANGQCTPTVTAGRCTDNDPCTDEKCDPVQGCLYPKRCQDTGDKCFKDYACRPADGVCLKNPVNCDDGNACTIEMGCDPAQGCLRQPLVCPPFGKNKCFKLLNCDTSSGCKYNETICDDGLFYTIDTCDPATGNCVFKNDTSIFCMYANCSTRNNKCFRYICNPNGTLNNCENVTVIDCDDQDKCTADSCINATGCSNVRITCPAPPPCMVAKCYKDKGCVNESIVCDDKDPCTVDKCNTADNTCLYTPLCNTTKNACTNQYCSLGVCHDDNLCALSPDPCFVTTKQCNISSGTCITAPLCDDNDKCTIDSCKAGKCTYTKKNCDDSNACTKDSCVAGQCKHDAIVCDDNDKCTVDSCDATSGCSYVKINVKKQCDDFNECTTDSCDPAVGCVNVNRTDGCADKDNCTIDSCHPTLGCQHTPRSCPTLGCDVGFCEKGQCKLTSGGCLNTENIAAVAGVGSGVIVGIIIGIILCVTAAAGVAAKGLGLFDAGAALDSSGITNPLYEQATMFGESKIYQGKDDSYLEMKQ